MNGLEGFSLLGMGFLFGFLVSFLVLATTGDSTSGTSNLSIAYTDKYGNPCVCKANWIVHITRIQQDNYEIYFPKAKLEHKKTNKLVTGIISKETYLKLKSYKDKERINFKEGQI